MVLVVAVAGGRLAGQQSQGRVGVLRVRGLKGGAGVAVADSVAFHAIFALPM